MALRLSDGFHDYEIKDWSGDPSEGSECVRFDSAEDVKHWLRRCLSRHNGFGYELEYLRRQLVFSNTFAANDSSDEAVLRRAAEHIFAFTKVTKRPGFGFAHSTSLASTSQDEDDEADGQAVAPASIEPTVYDLSWSKLRCPVGEKADAGFWVRNFDGGERYTVRVFEVGADGKETQIDELTGNLEKGSGYHGAPWSRTAEEEDATPEKVDEIGKTRPHEYRFEVEVNGTKSTVRSRPLTLTKTFRLDLVDEDDKPFAGETTVNITAADGRKHAVKVKDGKGEVHDVAVGPTHVTTDGAEHTIPDNDAWRAHSRVDAKPTKREQDLKLVCRESDIHEILFLPATDEFIPLTRAQWKELEEEEKYWDDLMKAMHESFKTAEEEAWKTHKEDVAKALKDVVKGPGKHDLTEIRRLKGAKWTYVRSDKVKNKTRKYKLDSDDGKRSLRAKNGKLDKKKLKEQFGNASVNAKAEFPLFEKTGNINFWSDRFDKFIDELNKDLAWSSTKKGTPDSEIMFEASADAALLRYYAGASVASEVSLKEGKFGLKVEGHAALALFEGTASSKCYFPSKAGFPLEIDMPLKKGGTRKVNLGNAMAEVSLSGTGFVGASAYGSIGIEVNPKGDAIAFRGTDPNKEASPASASGELFAGAKIGGKLVGAVKWDNPEKRKGNSPAWCEFLSVGYGVSAAAGIGAEGELTLHYKNGKFFYRAKAGVVFGVGASGALQGAIDAKSVFEFVVFVYHRLKDENFDYLGFLTRECFEAVTALMAYYAAYGDAVLEAKEYVVLKATQWWQETSLYDEHKRQQEAERLAEGLLRNPKGLVKFTTPQAKGRLLALLCQRSWLSGEERQEQAIIAVLSWVQSKREYHEVCKYMTLDGSKTTVEESEDKLLSILDGGEELVFNAMKRTNLARMYPDRPPRDTAVRQVAVLSGRNKGR